MANLTHFPDIKSNVVETPSGKAKPGRIPLGVRLLTIAGITLPFLGVVAALFFLWGWGFHWTDLGLLLGMYLVTILGIGVGFHRLFVHRSFETYSGVKFVLAVLGSMAVQGSLPPAAAGCQPAFRLYGSETPVSC